MSAVSNARDPFAAIEQALHADSDALPATALARVDPTRQQRTGVPEVVFGDAKPNDALHVICRDLLSALPRVIVSRIDAERAAQVAAALGDVVLERTYPGRTVVLHRPGAVPPAPRGRIAIFTAGTSDLPVAGEAATLAREMGCAVEIVADVGVAG